jgi:Ran GTPase-activating protein (RanGAP) involved in mRNA processing and transport
MFIGPHAYIKIMAQRNHLHASTTMSESSDCSKDWNDDPLTSSINNSFRSRASIGSCSSMSFRSRDGCNTSGQDVLNYLQRRGSEVEELTVCEVETFTDDEVREMEHLLVVHHAAIHLQKLELPRNGLTVAAGEPLANIVRAQHETLRALNVAHNPLTHLALSHLVAPLSTTSLMPSRVIHLDLTETQLGSKGAALVASLLRNNTCLRDLRLGRNNLGVKGIKALLKEVTTHPTLERLDISHNCIKSKGAALVAHALSKGPPGNDESTSSEFSPSKLKHLDITCNNIGAQGALALAKMLVLDRCLISLNCGANDLGPEGAAYLAPVLQHNYTLRELTLEENHIGPDAAALLLEQLAHDSGSSSTSALERLNLAWNNIGDEGAAELAKVLKANAVLAEVDLTGNKIGSLGAARLAEALAENSSLLRLMLTTNLIDNDGAYELAHALGKRHCPLESRNLDLKENPIHENGLASLARVPQLKRNRLHWLDDLLRDLWHGTIHSVNLSDRRVGDEEILLLANAMKESKKPLRILSLWVCGGALTPRGLVPLVRACLPSPAEVMRLYLKKCCNMGEESVKAIASSLKCSESLEVLCLVDCCVSAQGAVHIAEALATNKNLRRLNLNRNLIGDVGLTALADMLPHKSLTSLSANENGITDASMGCAGLTQIQELHLKRNAITDRGALAFAGSLAEAGNVRISWISLQDNRVTKRGGETIRTFIPEIIPGTSIVNY